MLNFKSETDNRRISLCILTAERFYDDWVCSYVKSFNKQTEM